MPPPAAPTPRDARDRASAVIAATLRLSHDGANVADAARLLTHPFLIHVASRCPHASQIAALSSAQTA